MKRTTILKIPEEYDKNNIAQYVKPTGEVKIKAAYWPDDTARNVIPVKEFWYTDPVNGQKKGHNFITTQASLEFAKNCKTILYDKALKITQQEIDDFKALIKTQGFDGGGSFIYPADANYRFGSSQDNFLANSQTYKIFITPINPVRMEGPQGLGAQFIDYRTGPNELFTRIQSVIMDQAKINQLIAGMIYTGENNKGSVIFPADTQVNLLFKDPALQGSWKNGDIVELIVVPKAGNIIIGQASFFLTIPANAFQNIIALPINEIEKRWAPVIDIAGFEGAGTIAINATLPFGYVSFDPEDNLKGDGTDVINVFIIANTGYKILPQSADDYIEARFIIDRNSINIDASGDRANLSMTLRAGLLKPNPKIQVDASSLLNKITPTFTFSGDDGSGVINSATLLTEATYTFTPNNNLSNGDTLKITFTANSGFEFTGTNEATFTIPANSFKPPVLGGPPPLCILTAGGNAYGGNFTNATKLAEFKAITDTMQPKQFTRETQLTCVHMPLLKEVEARGFESAIKLESASFPIAEVINDNAFGNCFGLKSIYIPNCITIGSNAFGANSSLSNINIDVATTIGDNAFYGIPNAPATTIRMSAFFDTTAQKDRIFGAGSWDQITFTWI